MSFAFTRTVDLYDTVNTPWESDEPTYAGVLCTPRKPFIAYNAYNQVDFWSGARIFICRFWIDPAVPFYFWHRDGNDIRSKLFLVFPEIPNTWFRLDYSNPYFVGDELQAWYVHGRQVGIDILS